MTKDCVGPQKQQLDFQHEKFIASTKFDYIYKIFKLLLKCENHIHIWDIIVKKMVIGIYYLTWLNIG